MPSVSHLCAPLIARIKVKGNVELEAESSGHMTGLSGKIIPTQEKPPLAGNKKSTRFHPK
jgi:hypothetical protein